jgi:beta-glucosidase/6-phospho-beta-glucosidase/beta-galactosidase
MVEQRIAPVRAAAPFPHLGAFESTKLMGSGTDILGTTRHIERWQDDLRMLRTASLQRLRYSMPWHRIERSPGSFDFTWIDGPMSFMARNGMTPILDPLHHISFPDWLEDGFANPGFPTLYERFITKVAERYPWANVYTIFNEPLPTTLFCSFTGGWYPHQASDECFVGMALNVARAICLASAAVRRVIPDAQFVHVETCETHRALDRRCEEWAAFANARRFIMHDLILGQLDNAHELYEYLRRYGGTEDILWLSDNRVSFDVLGLDYYIHSEMEWKWDATLRRPNISWPVQEPVGFAAVARDYLNRFDVAVMLSETNLRGSYLDRLTWLKFMEEQCEALARTSDFRGFCWYPSIDSTDWCHFCTKATGIVDPQGIWSLDQSRWKRHASELSDYYTRLAAGTATSKDLPAYSFSGNTADDLCGYEKLMSHWTDWREQDVLRAA